MSGAKQLQRLFKEFLKGQLEFYKLPWILVHDGDMSLVLSKDSRVVFATKNFPDALQLVQFAEECQKEIDQEKPEAKPIDNVIPFRAL